MIVQLAEVVEGLVEVLSEAKIEEEVRIGVHCCALITRLQHLIPTSDVLSRGPLQPFSTRLSHSAGLLPIAFPPPWNLGRPG
jgi:hypothetical protein